MDYGLYIWAKRLYSWLRHYATSWKIVLSTPDEVN
jgi:hypothetical protein